MTVFLFWAKPQAGSGPKPSPGLCIPIFCSDAGAASIAAYLFPDSPIQVRRAYRDPTPTPAGWWGRLAFALGRDPEGETHAELRRRVVELTAQLVEGAKKHGQSAFLGGPRMVRLLGYKLCAIGFRGPMFGKIRPMQPREYVFR